IEALCRADLAARCAVIDALAREFVETFSRKATPAYARRKDQRACAHDFIPVQIDFASRRIDACDRTGHQYLGAEALGLLQRAASEAVPRTAAGKTEIVLDPR